MILPTASSTGLNVQTQASITAAPSALGLSLRKRDQQCGIVSYPNAQAPICTGTASLCTFSEGRQGCCDAADSCTFYASCNGGRAVSCTDVSCLQCPVATPYCTRYQFLDDAGSSYDGFGCGVFDVGGLIIQGTVDTQQVAAETTSSISSSSQSSLASQTTPSSSTDASRSSSQTTSSSASTTSSAATSTGTSAANKESGNGSGGVYGAAIGGAVGGVVGAILLAALIWWFCWRPRHQQKREMTQAPQLSQSVHRQHSQYSQY